MTRFQKLFVITVCSFALTNYPAGSIGFLARYGSLVLLVVGVVVTLGEDFRSRGVRLILPAFALFLLECLITGFWSQNFELSIVKLMVYSRHGSRSDSPASRRSTSRGSTGRFGHVRRSR